MTRFKVWKLAVNWNPENVFICLFKCNISTLPPPPPFEFSSPFFRFFTFSVIQRGHEMGQRTCSSITLDPFAPIPRNVEIHFEFVLTFLFFLKSWRGERANRLGDSLAFPSAISKGVERIKRGSSSWTNLIFFFLFSLFSFWYSFTGFVQRSNQEKVLWW